jgi:hypothetical protein
MDGSAYRDCSDHVAEELNRLVNLRRIEIASTTQGWQSIYVRRWGRVVFGVVGTIGATAMAIVTALDGGYGGSMLIASWLFALLGWVLAREFASQRLRRHLEDELRLSGDALADTRRLQERGPKDKEAELSALRDRESIAWPLTTIALLGPLTIHLAIAMFFQTTLSNFEEWMQASGVIVGLSHIYMVRAAWRHPTERRPWKGLMWAIAASIPGLFAVSLGAGSLLFLIYGFPFVAAIILLTGSVLVWGAFAPLGELLDRERAWLEAN